MEFDLMARAYDTYGGLPVFSLVPDFLLEGSKGFGDGIRELTLTLHFATRGPARKTLERIYENFHRNRLTLPGVVFRRKRGQMAIDVSSDLIDGRDWKTSLKLSLPLFAATVAETVEALHLMKKRVKASDAFDLQAFLSHCEAARDRIPHSQNALEERAERLRTAREQKVRAMSPWERLGIDWDDFHPAARDVLDDPFFWESANDFSPNGNDTGADLLSAYRDWLRSKRGRGPLSFLQGLAKQWGYPGFREMDEEVKDESAIGLAFAELKLRGSCDEQVRRLALEAVTTQRKQAEEATTWPHREERLGTLKAIEAKLQTTGQRAVQ